MEDILEKIVSYCKDYFVEASISEVISDNVIFENKHVKNFNSGHEVKLNVRITNGKKSGYSFTTNLNNWKECVDRAVKLMKISKELKVKPVFSSFHGSKSFIDSSIHSLSLDKLMLKGKEALSQSDVNIPSFELTKEISKEYFVNSNLIKSFQERSEFSVIMQCSKENVSSWDYFSSSGDADISNFVSNTISLCKKSLNPEKISTGIYNVVFDFHAFKTLLSLFLPNTFANNIINHNSKFEGMKGELVSSENLTIIDCGILERGTNNCIFDSEGFNVIKKPIISKGVLSNYLNDAYTSAVLSEKPTGNSETLLFRSSIGINNLIVRPGDDKIDTSEYLYVYDLMGSHTANIVSGDFALSALNVFYKGRPIKDVVISGNIFDIFKKIVMVDKHPRTTSSFSIPKVLIRDVQVIS